MRPQRQQGYATVQVAVPQGDLSAEQFRGLARILRAYGNGRARTAQWQNIVLRWIPQPALYAVWRALGEIGLGGGGAQEITDIVTCPGTDSCKLGITSSMGLNRAVTEVINEMEISDPRTRRILINASGCPNSCGMHHLGNIGFHGAAIKAQSGDRQVPAYLVFVGGDRHDGRRLRLGTQLKLRIPAKRAPEVTRRLIELYEAQRQGEEEFNDFFDRVGREPFEEALRDLALPPEFSLDNMGEFIDWEREGLYVMERGEGECAV